MPSVKHVNHAVYGVFSMHCSFLCIYIMHASKHMLGMHTFAGMKVHSTTNRRNLIAYNYMWLKSLFLTESEGVRNDLGDKLHFRHKRDFLSSCFAVFVTTIALSSEGGHYVMPLFYLFIYYYLFFLTGHCPA